MNKDKNVSTFLQKKTTKRESIECKTLEKLCVDFMNSWDKCGKYPDTKQDIEDIDNVYHKMYTYIFG